MGATVASLKEKYPDLEIKNEGARVYTSDNLTSGLYRFINFASVGRDGNYIFETPEGEEIMLNPGIFKRNPSGWDIKAACTWLHNNSKSSSQHVCAKFVRMAIEAGGLSTAGRPTWAWKYIDYLPSIGFKMVAKVHRKDMHSFAAEPGDIAVYQKNGDPSKPGHICMWTGAEWASDFKQKSMIVYQNTQHAYVFRFQA